VVDVAPAWYALHVTARQEKAAHADLARRGLETFLPMRRERRAWSDRIQLVETALFPGYLFVRASLSASMRVQLLKSKGVHELVSRLPGDPRIARHIPDHEMATLLALCAAERALDPIARLVPGTPVRVAAGPLRGIHGVVARGPDGRRRLLAHITLLGRGVRTQLLADDVIEELEAVAA
jgi:transcriptional antiterminator RfaH